MSKWKMVKWHDVLDIKNGRNQKAVEDSNGKYPIYGSGGIMGYANDFLCEENSVIIGRKGSINKPIFVSEKFWNVDTAFGLVSKANRLISKYLYYFCLKYDFERLNTTVTIPSLTKAKLLNVEIPLPPLETQRKIAKTLDTVSEILAMRKQQLAELDNLIKSIFYDMFGNPVGNEKGWNTFKLDEIASKIGSGATPRGGKQSYQDEGISLIGSKNVYNGEFRYDELAHIDNEQARFLNNVVVKEDDVLINITGASVARSCIVPKDVLPARVNQHVSIVRVGNDCLIPAYLNNVIISDSYQANLLNIAGTGGATREAITKQQLQELEIPVPPIDTQQRFAHIKTNIEDQKSLVRKALDEIQYLFDSLMSRYFD